MATPGHCCWKCWRSWLPEEGGVCPECGEVCLLVKDISNLANLAKAQGMQTGPVTEEGKKKSSENWRFKTPEDYDNSRYNNVKHGAYAKSMRFFQARPGKWAECDGCVAKDACVEGQSCVHKTALMIQAKLAMDSGDPEYLKEIAGMMQGNTLGIMEMMAAEIVKSGVMIEEEIITWDKESASVKKIGSRWKENPVLMAYLKYVKEMGFTLSDWELTPKSRGDRDDADEHAELLRKVFGDGTDNTVEDDLGKTADQDQPTT